MTPQLVDTREESGNGLSTADLVVTNGTPGGSTLPMTKAAQEPNLPLFAPERHAGLSLPLGKGSDRLRGRAPKSGGTG
jgi:hypothetical protein